MDNRRRYGVVDGIIVILILLLSSLSSFGQVKPNNFIEETSPSNSNFEVYSQKNGVNRRASLSSLRQYFGAAIVSSVNPPAATGNPESIRNKILHVVADGSIWFVDWSGAAIELSNNAPDCCGLIIRDSVYVLSYLSDTIPLSPNLGDIFIATDTSGVYDGTQWRLLVTSNNLPDGDYGDIDISGGGTVHTVDTSAINSDKILDGTIANVDIGIGVGGIFKGSGPLPDHIAVTGNSKDLLMDGMRNWRARGVTTLGGTSYRFGLFKDLTAGTTDRYVGFQAGGYFFAWDNSTSKFKAGAYSEGSGLNRHFEWNSDNITLQNFGTGSTGFKGILYASDFSASYTDRSLIDRGYLNTRLSALSFPANLTFSGSGPFSLNSSSGTGVTFTAGTNITINRVGNNLDISASGGGSSYYQTVQDDGVAETQREALDFIDNSEMEITVSDSIGKTKVQVNAKPFGIALSKLATADAYSLLGNPTSVPTSYQPVGIGYGMQFAAGDLEPDSTYWATKFALEDSVAVLKAIIAGISGISDHGALTGLSDDDHTQYALLAGRAGGQTLTGGTGSGDDLTLRSTTNATKGEVYIQDQGGDTYIGNTSSSASLRITNGTTNRLGVFGSGSDGSASWNHNIVALNSTESSLQPLAISASVANFRINTSGSAHFFQQSIAPSTPSSLVSISVSSSSTYPVQEWRNGSNIFAQILPPSTSSSPLFYLSSSGTKVLQEWRSGANVIGSFSTSSGTSNSFTVASTGSSARGIFSEQHSNNIAGAAMNFVKSRGSLTVPAAVSSGDIVGAFTFRGYSGSGYLTDNCLFGASITGTVTTSLVPTSIFFIAGSNTSYLPDLLIHDSGRIGIGNGFGNITTSVTQPLALLHVFGQGSSATTWSFRVDNSAGTFLSGQRDDGVFLIGGSAIPTAGFKFELASGDGKIGNYKIDGTSSTTGKDGWISTYDESADRVKLTTYVKEFAALSTPSPTTTITTDTAWTTLTTATMDFGDGWSGSSGVLTYSGLTNRFNVQMDVYGDSNSTFGGVIEFAVFKNGVKTGCFSGIALPFSSSPDNCSSNVILSLSAGDDLELKVRVEDVGSIGDTFDFRNLQVTIQPL